MESHKGKKWCKNTQNSNFYLPQSDNLSVSFCQKCIMATLVLCFFASPL